MAALPFKVKASYEYKSPHEDDLSFPVGQIITVTEEEDDDWYVGEYTDASGEPKSGLFPKNFVERYEPAPPPRPARSGRQKPAEPPAPVHNDDPAEAEPPTAPVAAKSVVEDAPAGPAPTEQRQPSITSPPAVAQASEAQEHPPPAPKPAPAVPASTKGPPPPVAEKSSSFRDRIAAFNKPAAAPIAPFKPGGASTNTFIKKPFVAPPPARNAYVPPPREPAPQTIYRREEDPEIAERKAQDQEDAERAGLAPAEGHEEEEAPRAVSLKERIALLQKQQAEQAARRADHTHKRPKPERSAKKRTESYEHEGVAPRDSIDTEGARDSSDTPRETERPPSARRPSKGPKSPDAVPREREMFSDGNDADQSAAGETTDAGASTLDEDDEASKVRPPAAAPPQEEEEEEEEEETEEDDMDEETRRQIALRERMAKLSGGMGMAGMFGPQPGMAMPGMGGGFKKKRPTQDVKHAEEPEPTPASLPQRVPMIPIPGMGGVIRPDLTAEPEEEDEETEAPIEEIKPPAPVRTRTGDRTVPTPPKDSSAEAALSERVPPPVPDDRPTTSDSRHAPEAAAVQSPSPGSESDDEMPESAPRTAAPPIPSRNIPLSAGEPRSPPPVPTHPSQVSPTSPQTTSTAEKRTSRPPPPIPGSTPSSPAQSRPAPPLPPGVPSRSNTADSLHRRLIGAAGEEGSEYEGDYDTDIASGAKHKDALKAHAREPSLDDSTVADDTPLRSPPLSPPVPSGAQRAAPPPPPSQPPRRSTETQRSVLPAPAEARITSVGDDDDYDPYRYTSGAMPAARAPPPAPRQVPQVPSMPPPLPSHPPHPSVLAQDEDEDEEDEPEEEEELYAPPLRTSTDRPPPPLPPQIPPHERAVPPPPPSMAPGVPTPIAPQQPRGLPRQSTDMAGRYSMEQPRPSSDSGFIARDIVLNDGSRWWAQPNTPPLQFRNRPDVLFEFEESSTSKRGGKTTIAKDVYILFNDYSQTVVTARFDAKNPDDVSLDQRHEPPPAKLRQDQLEDAWTRFGQQIARETESKQNIVVGDGTPQALILELLRSHTSALLPVGTRSYGALVYANLANATVTQFDEIRPGDIVSFRNAKFQGKHGSLHAKYSAEAGKPDHVGVVGEWDGTKKKIRAWEQGRESKKVKSESFRLGDLRSGEVKVWRVMPRSWVGWEGES